MLPGRVSICSRIFQLNCKTSTCVIKKRKILLFHVCHEEGRRQKDRMPSLIVKWTRNFRCISVLRDERTLGHNLKVFFAFFFFVITLKSSDKNAKAPSSQSERRNRARDQLSAAEARTWLHVRCTWLTLILRLRYQGDLVFVLCQVSS